MAKKKAKPRTLRLRYMEPPDKPDGNPFFALRVDAGLLRAFRAHAKKQGMTPGAMVRQWMEERPPVVGVEGGDE